MTFGGSETRTREPSHPEKAMNSSPIAIRHEIPTESQSNSSLTIAKLAVGLLGLGLVFKAEVVTAFLTWEASTAYNHCFLVIPITLYMIWDRRHDLRHIPAQPLPSAALLGLAPAIGWLVAERLGIMEGRQLMVIAFAEVLFLAILGWRLCWTIAGPLLYLFFLVPFGEFLVPKLQDITAVFIAFGLGLTNIPAYIDGYVIEIPAGTFYVAEACAGLRFLVASFAFGVLYALMMYKNPMRQTAFILVSVIVPVIANGFRALGIVLLGHWLGSAEAAAADHILYGWVFFSLVILMLIVLGLPFREDARDRRRSPQCLLQAPTRLTADATAIVSLVAVAAFSPALTVAMDRTYGAEAPRRISLDLPIGCELSKQLVDDGRAAIGQLTLTRVLCGGLELDVAVQTFPRRSTAGPIIQEKRRLTRPRSSESVAELPIVRSNSEITHWRLIESTSPDFLAVAGVWVDGLPSETGFRMRVALAKASLFGSRYAPALVVVTPRLDRNSIRPTARREIEDQLIQFVLGQSYIDEQIRDATTLPGS